MSPPETFYEVLGIAPRAPDSVIRAVYRALQKDLHPDRGGAVGPGDSAKVNEAYRVLSNPSLRKAYDKELASIRERAANVVPQSDPDADSWGEEVDWTVPAAQNNTSPQPSRPEVDFAASDPASLAGVNVFEREDIRLDSMPWYTRDYATDQTRKFRRPDGRRILRAAGLACGALWVLLGAAPFLIVAFAAPAGSTAWVVNLVLTALIVVAVLGVGVASGLKRARRQRGLFRYIVYIVLALAAAWLWYQQTPPMAFAVIGHLLLWLFAVELLRASPVAVGQRARRLLPAVEVRKFTIWGRAGGGIANAFNTFGNRNAYLGATAELMTGQLLEQLTRMPGVRIVHGLVFPNSQNRDVDHAVLCGNRLAFVDSKHWHGGDYFWLGEAVIQRLRNYEDRVVETHFEHAVHAYRNLFPQLEVASWVVIHSNDGVAIRTNNVGAPHKPKLATGSQLLTELGEWLSEGQPSKVNRRDLSRLVLEFGKA